MIPNLRTTFNTFYVKIIHIQSSVHVCINMNSIMQYNFINNSISSECYLSPVILSLVYLDILHNVGRNLIERNVSN